MGKRVQRLSGQYKQKSSVRGIEIIMGIGARKWDSNSAMSKGMAVRQSLALIHVTSMSEAFGGRSVPASREQPAPGKCLSLHSGKSIEWPVMTAEDRMSQESRR